MKKTDIVKLALSGWKLSDIKELVELENTMNKIDSKEPEPETEPEQEPETEPKPEQEQKQEPEPEPETEPKQESNDKFLKMIEVIKKLQDDNTRKNIEQPKNEEDILKDMFRDFM